MTTMIFPNLPVKDLDAAKKFYTALGYKVNQQFTDDNASAIVVSDAIVIMLMREEFFNTFDSRTIADTSTTVESLHALGVDSREDVDRLIADAGAAGGSIVKRPEAQGPMYGGSFKDLDGHHWEVMHMDPSAVEPY
ncbi:MAG TPA: VOC family protein [Stackebrandtia sp.]|jgi:predicted lactoylglutathione lyase|uniref:VOC family protein n=1 Tax=Stackebrandtia sp. TaxID=2023065 RepID=UPI002D32DEEB|nr:VOC family protein [Stackebrandtia sp.]HZE38176.1 VOC family protein [Stackebrandtia sp.]